jgi:hypothetical protein
MYVTTLSPSCGKRRTSPSHVAPADADRADFVAILDELEFLKVQVSRLPTRRYVAELVGLEMAGTICVLLATMPLLSR